MFRTPEVRVLNDSADSHGEGLCEGTNERSGQHKSAGKRVERGQVASWR